MKRGIDHVPISERRELERIIDMIRDEFEDALSLAQREWRLAARITKIVLYGSHARGDWVDEHFTRVGKHSDWDLIVLVNEERLTNRTKHWKSVTERLSREYEITHRLRSPVQFYVYTIDQINTSLRNGRYFFVDFYRDGIIVYENDETEFSPPIALPPPQVYAKSAGYYERWFRDSLRFFKTFEFSFNENWTEHAAIQLQQSVEHIYQTVLLVQTLYTPHSRNIVELRRFAEKLVPELAEAWPRERDEDVAAFELLQQAYVKEHYLVDYEIARGALAWLGERTRILIDLVETSCKAHLAELKRAATV